MRKKTQRIKSIYSILIFSHSLKNFRLMKAFQERSFPKEHKSPFLYSFYSILQVTLFFSPIVDTVKSRDFENVICWSQDGDYFKILNPAAFSEDVLSRFYKHSEYSSFIRQVNLLDQSPSLKNEIARSPWIQKNLWSRSKLQGLVFTSWISKRPNV